MTVKIDLKPEIEQGLLAQARELGVSLDAYLLEIVSRHARRVESPAVATSKVLKLPVLHLGVMSSLHRRDLDDDAR